MDCGPPPQGIGPTSSTPWVATFNNKKVRVDVKNNLRSYWRGRTPMSQILMNCAAWKKSYLKNEIDNFKKVNDERVNVIENLTSQNEALKDTQ